MLEAWRRWAAAKRAAREQQQQAALHFAARTAQAALLTWRLAVAAKQARRQQQELATAHWAQWRAALVLAQWRRWAALRRRAPEAHVLYLLHSSFGAWRREAARKASKAARQRLAVRQCYLRQLWAGWAAWQQHHRRQQQKGQQLETMRLYRSSVLLRHCWAAWWGPFLTAARSKRAAVQLAERHAECQLLRQALVAWCGPFMTQARQLRELQRRADAFRAAALLRTALHAWSLWCTWQAEKQHRVEAAQALLRPGRLRRLLLAWLNVCASRARLRRQVGRRKVDRKACGCSAAPGLRVRFSCAKQHAFLLIPLQAAVACTVARRRMLCVAWLALQQHVTRQQHKRSLWCRALLFSSLQQQQQVFSAWRGATKAAGPQLAEGGSHAEDAAADNAADLRDDSIAALLDRMRQLQTTAAESLVAGQAQVAGPAVGKDASQWCAANIANIPPGRVVVAAGWRGDLGGGKEQVGLPAAVHTSHAMKCAALQPPSKLPQPRPLPSWAVC